MALWNRVCAKRDEDELIHGLFPNTKVPRNWFSCGETYIRMETGDAHSSGLSLGPELTTVYTDHAGSFVDASCELLKSNRLWRTTPNPNCVAIWVRGANRRVLPAAQQREWEAKRDARIAGEFRLRQRRLDAQRRSRAQAQAQARLGLGPPAPAPAPAPAPRGYDIDDLARILGVEPLPPVRTTPETIVETARSALDSLHSALRPLRPAPTRAQIDTQRELLAPAVSLETALGVVMKHLHQSQPKEDEEKKTCSVCMDAAPDTVFTKCGHVCACADCARRLGGSGVARKCPICRQLSKTVRLHFA